MILVSRFCVNAFLRVTICRVSGCIGKTEEKFNVESWLRELWWKWKTVWYGCVVTVTVTIVWKRRHFNVICCKHLLDVGDEMCLVLIVFVFLWDPSWLLFNELKNKACHYSLIVTKFLGRYIQVRDNEIVDSASLQSDRVRYVQVNLNVNIRGNFWEVIQWLLYTDILCRCIQVRLYTSEKYIYILYTVYMYTSA